MTDIFARMDIRQVRSFLLYGEESCEIQNADYDERLKKAEMIIYEILKNAYQENSAFQSALNDVNEAISICQEVYAEIGMKFAAKIMFQLLQ